MIRPYPVLTNVFNRAFLTAILLTGKSEFGRCGRRGHLAGGLRLLTSVTGPSILTVSGTDAMMVCAFACGGMPCVSCH